MQDGVKPSMWCLPHLRSPKVDAPTTGPFEAVRRQHQRALGSWRTHICHRLHTGPLSVVSNGAPESDPLACCGPRAGWRDWRLGAGGCGAAAVGCCRGGCAGGGTDGDRAGRWRKQRLLDQLELQLDELEASATEDELAAEQAAAGTTQVKRFARRKPFPAHLPRERVCGAGADCLRVLRIGEAVEDRRGRDRDAGGDPAPLEGDPDGAREVHLPPFARRSPSRRRRSTRHPGAGRVPTCWR